VHLANGVQIVKGRRVIGLRGRGAVESVELDDGRTLAADLVICGLGASPRTELASDAGLRFDGGKAGAGIAVDARLESSVPGVFAAGDVAAAWHPLYRRNIRVEHWDNAKRQGRFAAGAMLGRTDQYERIPYFYSDQFDLGMEYTGFAPQWDEVVFRGEPLSRKFIAFWLLRGKVVAGMNMNTWDVAPSIERLVRAQATVEREALADPARPLDELTPVPVAA
jgi:3-phenylpropionate/trans-cinnamate dioxygenase ferredoxin reductase subunit